MSQTPEKPAKPTTDEDWRALGLRVTDDSGIEITKNPED